MPHAGQLKPVRSLIGHFGAYHVELGSKKNNNIATMTVKLATIAIFFAFPVLKILFLSRIPQ